jgi:membrane protein YdbS with pleckstrin-like domain
VSPRRRSGDDLYGGGDLEPVYPQPSPDPYVTAHSRTVEPVSAAEPRPGLLVRAGRRFDGWRRRVIPLPDEIVDEYLGHGERVIHSDHPSLQAFIVQNTLLFAGLFVIAVLVGGIALNGSLVTAGIALLILSVVLLFLVLKRLGERYTSYVVTNVRIMRIKGIVSRRAHSIPWVRVTDLTYEQTLTGRLFGFATLHIESANEDSGLRDLEGVSDPMKFNQYVVDMVVAKQGPTAPLWEQLGEPAPIISTPRVRMRDRFRSVRRRRTRVDVEHGGSTTTTVARRRDPTAPPLIDPTLHESDTGPDVDDSGHQSGDAPYDFDLDEDPGGGTGAGSGSGAEPDDGPEGPDDLDWRR